MSTERLLILLHYLTIMIAFVVITYAAIAFERIGILWWYLLPFFMSYTKINIKEGD